jgi:PKD repeat protein/thiol-disulfide isomerase/thioredoxin
MKSLLRTLLFLIIAIPTPSFGQLPPGANAPDFTLTDINGNTHNLYSLLDQGKMVVLEFSATWCGPCWNYMLTGALEDFWNEYGPNGTGEAQVFYIEADFATGMADLLGQTSGSQGNWVANIPFPIIDLQPGQNTANDYDIAYYPTLYAVCSDHTVYELGQVPASAWAEFLESCLLESEVANIAAADCYGEGSVTLETSGGVPPIDYDWSNGDNGPTLDNVGAGTYSVTVTEDNGKFVIIEDIIVTGQDAPISLASSEVEDVLCNGLATGSISIQLEEGTPPYSYDWSNGAHTQNLVNVQANEYGVTATDDNGCEFETSFEVTEPDAIEVVAALTPDYCDLGNGTIALDIEGGVGGYEVSSSEGNVFGTNIIDLPAGSVDVEVEDNNGCIWADDYNVIGEAAPDLYFSPAPSINCVQPTTVVTGYLDGGSGDFNYQWTTINGHIVGPTNQAAITVDAEGDYFLNVEDIFTGCEIENDVFVISQIDPPVASAGEDAPISCENLQLTLAGTGNPAYTVTWTTVNGHIISGANTYNPIVDAAGDYSMTVVNPANSCSTTDAAIVINNMQPAVAQYNYQTSGLTMIGNDQSSGSNVTGWSWTFGDGGSSNEPNAVHTFATPGTFQVCLTVQNGCGLNQSCQMVEVSFIGSVLSVNSVITDVLCSGDSTGNIVLVVNGGSGIYTYQWTGPDGATYSTPDLQNVVAGVYQLVITDDVGNIFIGEYTVNQPAQIILANSAITDNLCFGDLNGSISIDIDGGVGPFSYSFNGGASQQDSFLLNQASGDYICVVTDANGCQFLTAPITIAQPADLNYQTIQTNVRCFGESNGAISLQVSGGVSPYSYLWSTGENSATELINLAAGQYTCLVTDQHGCTDNLLYTVTQPDLLQANNIQVVDATGPTQNNGSITIDPIGGTAPYAISWNTGATGNKIEGLLPGEYTYSIIDAHGCTFNPAGPVVVGFSTSTTHVGWSSNISITPNPSNGNVVIRWHDLSVGKGSITLLTLEGKKIADRDMESGSGFWDLSAINLDGGIYLVFFQINNQSVPFKLVVVD